MVRSIHKNLEKFNVLDYGALGDGATDDTAAIKACITASQTFAKGSGIVFFPRGTFMVSASLAYTAQRGLVFEGHSKSDSVVKLLPADSNQPIFQLTDCDGAEFRDLGFDGNYVGGGGDLNTGVTFSGQSLTVTNCGFYKTSGGGVFLDGTADTGNVHVNGNEFLRVGTAALKIFNQGVNFQNRINFVDNHVLNVAAGDDDVASAVYMNSGNAAGIRGINIVNVSSNNVSNLDGADGAVVYAVTYDNSISNVVVSGNVSTGSQNGVAVRTDLGQGNDPGDLNNWVINGNDFATNDVGVRQLTANGGIFRNLAMAGNNIVASFRGVQIAAVDSQITGNTFNDPSVGVALFAGSARVDVNSNHFSNVQPGSEVVFVAPGVGAPISALQIGSGYIWVDNTGDLRISTARPTAQNSGVVVGVQV